MTHEATVFSLRSCSYSILYNITDEKFLEMLKEDIVILKPFCGCLFRHDKMMLIPKEKEQRKLDYIDFDFVHR